MSTPGSRGGMGETPGPSAQGMRDSAQGVGSSAQGMRSSAQGVGSMEVYFQSNVLSISIISESDI